MAATVAPMVEPQIAERRLTYVERVEPGLTARADVDRLQQIVLNLLSNAVKFTPAEGLVTLSIRRDRGGVLDALCARNVVVSGYCIPAECVFCADGSCGE